MKHAHIIVSPIKELKEDFKIVVNASTFNELVNRVNRLENEQVLYG